MFQPVLAIVIPCFNEEACIFSTASRLVAILSDLEKEKIISSKSFLFFVDDGSCDNTWKCIINERKVYDKKIKGIKFSRNFGNQKAILAGLTEAGKLNADCLITIDADLQQDEFKIKDFVLKYKEGYEIVCGVRKDRKTDGFLKKLTALGFYKVMNVLGVSIKPNHSDYRLIGKNALKALNDFKETNLFLRGIFNDIGFEKTYIEFEVKPREKGTSKFTPFKLFALAVSGITSFSIVPLRMVTTIGFLMSFVSFIIGISAFIDKLFRHTTVPGWTTIVVALGLIGGIQILCIGIIGEYLGQLFQEVKNRPRYIVESFID